MSGQSEVFSGVPCQPAAHFPSLRTPVQPMRRQGPSVVSSAHQVIAGSGTRPSR